ncbi:DUF1330 domain-containing protein [Streptomyces sp. 900105755]
METLEGAPFDGVLIHRFPSVADARAWHESPAYQAALPHRQAGANYRVFIVEGASATQGHCDCLADGHRRPDSAPPVRDGEADPVRPYRRFEQRQCSLLRVEGDADTDRHR